VVFLLVCVAIGALAMWLFLRAQGWI